MKLTAVWIEEVVMVIKTTESMYEVLLNPIDKDALNKI